MNFWFYFILGVLATVVLPAIYIRRKNLAEVYFPLVIWRMRRGKSIFDRIARISPRFWKSVGDIGVIFGFGVLGAYYLLRNRISFQRVLLYFVVFISSAVFFSMAPIFFGRLVPPIFSNPLAFSTMIIFGYGIFSLVILVYYAGFIILQFFYGNTNVFPGVVPLIPGVKIPGVEFYLPLHTIISIAIVLIIHEGFHGIVARVEKFKLKSYGVLSLGIVPIGGFVEPDEGEVMKAKSIRRVRLYSSGSMGNFVGAFVFLIVLLLVFPILSGYMLEEEKKHFLYYRVLEILENSSLHGLLEPNDTIYNFDLIYNRTPNSEVLLTTNKGEIHAYRDSNGLLGVIVEPVYSNLPITYYLVYVFIDVLKWTWFLNFILGIVNYLPFAIMDGSRILEEILRVDFKEHAGRISRALSYFVALILIINALPLFL